MPQTLPPPPAAPPLTREALAVLFAQANFQAFQKPGFPSHYWAPLISACSGTGRNDIFFLFPDDFVDLHGITVMRIRPRGSDAAARAIPVHPTLKRLGLLEFVQERQQTRPGERLFSEYRAIQEQAGVPFSRAFVQWIRTTAARLPESRQQLFAEDFHFPSLRALFSAEAIRSGMSLGSYHLIHGARAGERPDPGQERAALILADAELQQVDIEACFPALYPYHQLTA